MTPERIRIVIAEFCGWREAFPRDKEPHKETKRGGILLPYTWVNEITHERVQSLPDYISDLNAMHEAEKMLDDEQYSEYVRFMMFQTINKNAQKHNRNFLSATAQQRAEAFVKTIGKWEE